MLLHKINRQLETLKFTVHFTQPISGWIRVEKIATGYMGAAIFESLQLIKRVIVNLIACLHMEFANTISKLISRVISEILITRAFGTRVIISDITLLFVC